MDLTTLPSSEREKHYAALFGKTCEPIHLLQLPTALGAAHPALAAEIHAAYLRHTTFTVDVWLNYDTTAQRFYTDARAADCGRLRLPPTAAKRLHGLEFARVRLEVCTPFTRLARVSLRVAAPASEEAGAPPSSRLQPPAKGFYAPHGADALLRRGLEHVLEGVIARGFASPGREGWRLAELEALARYFRIVPRAEALTRMGWVRDTAVWMNVGRPGEWNEGFVREV